MSHTLLELFDDCVHRHGGSEALHYFAGETWESKSWKVWWAESERFAAALIDRGIEPGDRLAILCETRVEWVVADIGAMMAGAVVVPLYPSAGVGSTAHILEDSGPRIIFVEDPSQLDKISRSGEAASTIEQVVLLEREANFVHGDWDGRRRVALADVEWSGDVPVTNYDTLLADGRRALSEDAMLVAQRRSQLADEDIATIVYTSGTEYAPKGVVLTHGNLASEAEAMRELQLLTREDVQLLFLPLAHIFARALLFASIAYRTPTIIGRGPAHLVDDARATSPTFFAAVPQIYERLQLSFETQARRSGGWREKVFDAATAGDAPFGAVGRRVANELVHRRIDAALGGKLRFLVSGGAPLPRSTCEFFTDVGIPLVEGYGLTETAAVTCANHPDDVRPGTVGRPLPGVEVAIDEDGEILVRGQTVTTGYFRREESVLDEDGWFATGDLGQFDRDGYLTITGRKKEMIVTSGGKNIAPAPIETALRDSPLVADAYAHGDERPYVVVLLVPEESVVRELAAAEGVEVGPVSRWNEEPWVRRQMSKVLDDLNSRRARFEAVRTFAVVAEPFAEERGEKTPTGKLRRDAIAETRADVLSALYGDSGS